MDQKNNAGMIEDLKKLEYQIRKSIAVREDQEDDVEPELKKAAEQYGLMTQGLNTKGDLLGAVQTLLRSIQSKMQ